MTTIFFIKGILIGFSMMLAIGPIALLCISRTIERGLLPGVAVGLGAATADGTYGLVAAFGLSFITNFLTEYDLYIKLVGGTFLLYLGAKTFRSKLTAKKAEIKETKLFRSYLTTYLLTLTSPMTIILFMTIFAGLGLGSGTSSNYLSSSALVIGVFLGSASFYIILSSIITFLGSKLTSKTLSVGHRLSGLLICGFGVSSILSLISF